MSNKIFIQIASYRDPELIPTIKSCIENASNPEHLSFAICWQHSAEDVWDNLDEYLNDHRFKIISINYSQTKGCCWARNKIQQLYDGEEYTLQLDSHHRFIKGWDTVLINMYNLLKEKGFSKPLITSYVPSYNPENDPNERVMVPWKIDLKEITDEKQVLCIPSNIDEKISEPILAKFYSAHFAFTTGQFVLEVPHDPELYFHGEEISITVRAYTWGYDLFHPHKSIVWHEYTREGRTKHWDDDAEWWKKNSESHLRNRKLFEMDGLTKDIDFGMYDFGPKRTLADYERYAGISFKRRRAHKYTLSNNVPPNPETDGDFEDISISSFKHRIDLSKGTFVDTDYDFWAIIFEDEMNTSVYRKDLNEHDIHSHLNAPTTMIRLDVEFDTTKPPFKWIVWPHSKSKGWLEKIENRL